MTVLFDIILCGALAFLGYIFTYNYLNGRKMFSIDRKLFVWSAPRLYYLLAVVAIFSTTITVFHMLYDLSVIEQFRLLTLISLMIPAAAVDYKVQKIPNAVIISAFVLRIVLLAAEFAESVSNGVSLLKDDLIGMTVIGGFFLLIMLIFKNSIGMGDVKMFAVMGIYQGLWGAFNSVFFSLLVSFVLSIALLVAKKKKKHDTIPFGPSILIGTVIAVNLAGM